MATPIGRLAASAVLTTGLVGAAVVGPSAGAAQPESTESYVVVMAADPVVAYDGGEPGLAATEIEEGEKLDVDAPEVEEYVDHLEGEQLAAASEAGIDASDIGDSFTYSVSGFEADLTEAEVAALLRDDAVAVVVPNEFRQLQTDASISFLGLDGEFGLHPSGYTGEDVVVGIIDSGIWPEHPSFADDGSYATLPDYAGVPCEFGAVDYNADDQPFECNDKLLGARDMRTVYKTIVGPETFDSARDYDGHGTHVAGTAAGNAGVSAEIFGIDRGVIGGVAPRARVIAYSACGDLGCVTSDLVGAIDAAVADGVDVINYSIGGGATLTDPADIAFLFAADAGVWVATSAGNDGPAAGTVGGPGTIPWITTVGASSHDRTYQSVARFGNGTIATGASVTGGTDGPIPLVDAADFGNELCEPDVAFTGDISGLAVLCLRGAIARVDKSRAVAEQGGAAMVLYNADDAQAEVTDLHFVPSTHISFSTGLVAKDYIAAAGGAATVQLLQGEATGTQPSVMADFSARGANAVSADLIKPDVTAPGVNILAGHTPFPSVGAGAQLFQSISGTSMSSPHVAGLFALIRQAHPDWTAAMAKSAIMTTARQDVVKEDGVTPADPFDMGAGHVDPSGGAGWRGTMLSPGLLYDADLLDYFAFLCGADPSVFLDPASVCGGLVAGGASTAATDLNLPSIGAGAVAGSITIERTVTSVTDVWRSFRPIIEAPPGFSVEVSEDRLRVGPGDTAGYEVTITNVSAPIGEWAHGALTWKSGPYEVRSPISVRATLLDAPGTVVGFGSEGSVGIPTQFGFDGAYTALPHGPAAQVDIPGTVGQDPDQQFDPADPVGVTTFDYTTSGVAYGRIVLETEDLDVPDPDVDIDLYVLNSAGEVVGASTAGGTNELIDLLLPPDDTYTLYVHGWQTGGVDVGFTLRTFEVPLEPGTGALAIDSAPAEVSLGESTVVVASWSDLAPGTDHLGAVSHSDADGLVGLTLVEIST
ncbi:MAG: S8 family peptidase [Actinomycetota bacterium]